MGRDNNNAGMHLIRKGGNGFDDWQDVEAGRALYFDDTRPQVTNQVDNDIVRNVMENNSNVVLCESFGQYKECECGGKLKYKSDIYINYFKGNEIDFDYFEGLICLKCDRKYLIKQWLLDRIKYGYVRAEKQKKRKKRKHWR